MQNIKIIAEIGSNWNGSEQLGKKIIKSAKLSGADYVKFQMWRASDLYKPSHPYWKEIKKSEFTPQMAKKLKEYADSLHIDCFWSVFYPEAVDVLEDLNVKLYKIASVTSALKHKFSLETMEKISKTKKPVIISMGFGGDKNNLKKIFHNNKQYFLYCIPRYPTNINSISFKEMTKFDGFSDHTKGILAPIIFALKNHEKQTTKFLEKHISIRESRGADKLVSLDINNFQILISEIKKINTLYQSIF